MAYEYFNDIAPFDDSCFQERMAQLVKEPGFEHAVRWVFNDIDYPAFAQKLTSIKTQDSFQHEIMLPFLETLAARTTSGVSIGGLESYVDGESYTFISNHRDIVLDASFLNLGLGRNGKPTTEVAIGNNLLIFPWIDDLVRLNKSFVVKRGTKLTAALEAAKQLSAYIHYAISEKHQCIWIAQREGRAKDSDDRTQESLIKMLGMYTDGGTFIESIRQINMLPVAISYEYDPNDYLKAREFLLKRRDPDFKKSQRDDLFSMETGLLQFKGHVHFQLTHPINPQLSDLDDNASRSDVVSRVCTLVDKAIHAAYRFYPINYIAYDLLDDTERFADKYTTADIETTNEYIDQQLSKVEISDLTPDEMEYMRRLMLTMYANPVRNSVNV